MAKEPGRAAARYLPRHTWKRRLTDRPSTPARRWLGFSRSS